jgi:hypothetical protein
VSVSERFVPVTTIPKEKPPVLPFGIAKIGNIQIIGESIKNLSNDIKV